MTKFMKVNPLIDPEGAQSGSASYDSGSSMSSYYIDKLITCHPIIFVNYINYIICALRSLAWRHTLLEVQYLIHPHRNLKTLN